MKHLLRLDQRVWIGHPETSRHERMFQMIKDKGDKEALALAIDVIDTLRGQGYLDFKNTRKNLFEMLRE